MMRVGSQGVWLPGWFFGSPQRNAPAMPPIMRKAKGSER